MKQLEFKNHEEILSILMFYQDIGVDLSILQNEQIQKNKSLEKNKNTKNVDNNTSTSNIILNEEQKGMVKKEVKEVLMLKDHEINWILDNIKKLKDEDRDLFEKFKAIL